MEELEAELAQLRAIRRTESEGASFFAKVAVWIWIGPSLVAAANAWIVAAKERRERLPVPESAELIAAIIRRLTRIGAVGLFIACLPSFILIWHGSILENSFREQVEQTAVQRQGQAMLLSFEFLTRVSEQRMDPKIAKEFLESANFSNKAFDNWAGEASDVLDVRIELQSKSEELAAAIQRTDKLSEEYTAKTAELQNDIHALEQELRNAEHLAGLRSPPPASGVCGNLEVCSDEAETACKSEGRVVDLETVRVVSGRYCSAYCVGADPEPQKMMIVCE